MLRWARERGRQFHGTVAARGETVAPQPAVEPATGAAYGVAALDVDDVVPIAESLLQPEQTFWPERARIALGFTLTFDADGPDAPYGFAEGAPRLLDIVERYGVKVTAFVDPADVARAPALARELVRRGHEAAVCLRHDALRAFEAVERASGERPKGACVCGPEGAPASDALLAESGLIYAAGTCERDEPCLVREGDRTFVRIPGAPRARETPAHAIEHWDAYAYEHALRDEFDQLYEEAARRRRMMPVALHAASSGRPRCARALARFLEYATARGGVWIARHDEIAREMLSS